MPKKCPASGNFRRGGVGSVREGELQKLRNTMRDTTYPFPILKIACYNSKCLCPQNGSASAKGSRTPYIGPGLIHYERQGVSYTNISVNITVLRLFRARIGPKCLNS